MTDEVEVQQELIEDDGGALLGTVVKDEELATNRKVVVPKSKQTVAALLVAIHEGCVEGKFSGVVRVNYNDGGVPNIVTEHVVDDLEGLFGDDDDDGEEVIESK